MSVKDLLQCLSISLLLCNEITL